MIAGTLLLAASHQEWWHRLPALNASLNATSALLLFAAFIMIKRKRVAAHRNLMIAAVVTSAVFLSCYLVYHAFKVMNHEVVTRFPDGPWKPVYLAILMSHTLLAIVILPLIFSSLWLAWKRRWKLHHRVSSITFPLWFYVSVTGVVVYWMLYQWRPPGVAGH